jgi:hypothetical protein
MLMLESTCSRVVICGNSQTIVVLNQSRKHVSKRAVVPIIEWKEDVVRRPGLATVLSSLNPGVIFKKLGQKSIPGRSLLPHLFLLATITGESFQNIQLSIYQQDALLYIVFRWRMKGVNVASI